MNKALFLDRDGVINIERGKYTYELGDFKINKSIKDLILAAKNKNYLIIVISNQGGIAKGLYTKSCVIKLHERFQQLIDIKVDDFYFCPHHEKYGKCLCRKPDSILLEKAIAKYRLNPKKCFFIGDSERDVKAAESAGVIPIKVKPNSDLKELIRYL
jgi:D-glycero-D-manno-heptose 1,7-bisphosphate phosphatase